MVRTQRKEAGNVVKITFDESPVEKEARLRRRRQRIAAEAEAAALTPGQRATITG